MRVLIADDQELIRVGFRMILEAQPDITVVAEVADGQSAYEAAQRLRPDVCLLDIRMPSLDGLAVTRLLSGPDVADPIAVVVITMFDVAAVAGARRDSDLVVVLPHWGVEGNPCPTPAQRDFAARLAGAGVIAGAHAHVLQGAGRLGDAYVAYGLGNLLFYYHPLYQPFSSRSGLLRLTILDREVTKAEFLPTVITRTGQPELVTGWQADVARQNAERLRACAGVG
ncbi:CheY-like chemotaxis protein [Catenuloplanes nepalensis]|uniref:CheY-like chemotaxis protein n=1 Tax=Catenuloplanes nepalensis TaxID=587533 RepID=A0ABT9N802_9ACTN|nr:CheY-like chemotaxis protein [Catenuloplanes nepalensis]